MDRVTRFRGISLKTKEFVFGDLVYNNGDAHICSELHNSDGDSYYNDIVDPETIGQFTGLKDRNNKDIYERDIVNYAVKKRLCTCKNETDLFLATTKFCSDCGKEVQDRDFVETCEVKFMHGGFVLYREEGDYYQAWQTFIAETYIDWKEIIGNVDHNMDMLEWFQQWKDFSAQECPKCTSRESEVYSKSKKPKHALDEEPVRCKNCKHEGEISGSNIYWYDCEVYVKEENNNGNNS